MGIGEDLIREIVGRTLAVASVKRIILFGSAAAGQMTQDSDVDLLILSPTPPKSREERVRIRQALRGLGFPFDVFLMSLRDFEETKEYIGGVAHPAYKYGRVIYEAA